VHRFTFALLLPSYGMLFFLWLLDAFKLMKGRDNVRQLAGFVSSISLVMILLS
jgi:hypothetical protein